MNLAIDVGNTFIKAGIFENGHLVTFHPRLREEELKNLSSKTHPDHIIVSSVSKNTGSVFALFPSVKKALKLDHSLKLPFKNLYKTPQTLGMDRIAAAAGAISMFPDKDRLVIDAGTCITYDFTDQQGRYHGGGISPGIEIRFKALNTFTEKLPLVPRTDAGKLIGSDTEESIVSGVMNGVIAEVSGIIDQYKQRYPLITIIICGGDASFFESKIKETIFAVPELVLVGLNRILEYNVSEV